MRHRYLTPADVECIVARYVETVRTNDSATWPAIHDVLAAINDGTGDTWEVIGEMCEVAATLGIRLPDYDDEPDEVDQMQDDLHDALATVAARLTTNLPTPG